MGAAEGHHGRERPDRGIALGLYASHAAAYDEDTEFAGPDRARAVELLALRPGEVVLDVGCGTGLSFAPLRAQVGEEGRVIGIDQSVDMLEQAQERIDRAGWTNLDLVLGAVEAVEIPRMADAALFCFTHDVMRTPAALDNVMSHLRPGGRVSAVGPMWAPWWAPAMNVLIWCYTSPYVTTYEGFEQPWSHLAARVPGLSVDRQEVIGKYFAWGLIG